MLEMDHPRYCTPPAKYQSSTTDKPLLIKQIPPQNIVCRLFQREIWGSRRAGTEKRIQRAMCQSICPNFTVTHVEKPPCFLRKFTPDGKYFVSFSSDQISVELYRFKGPQAAAHLFYDDKKDWLRNKPPKSTYRNKRRKYMNPKDAEEPFAERLPDLIQSDDSSPHVQHIRQNMFSAFFQLQFRVNVAPQGEQLNRECSLFTNDFRYMIVGSATYNSDDSPSPSQHEVFRNNESLQPSRFQLADYTLHIIDLRLGVLSDSRSFKSDSIFLSHNQGVYLYNQTLAVLSVQHQTVTILHVEDGQFSVVRVIGRFCYEDDELLVSRVPEFFTVRPSDESFLTCLKHRILTFIYKKAKREAEDPRKPDSSQLVRFHQYFQQLRNLKIWKMQLLDEDHLLLKYSSEDVASMKCNEPNSQYCLFVLYEISSTKIVEVFENTSELLVNLFENFADNFRNNFMTEDARYSSSPCNNIYAKQLYQKFRQTITSARFGGPVEATRRILAQIPISAQSYSSSPYLDQALFSYDDHRVSAMERPKACGEMPIRFYGRDSGLYKFQIHAGILSKGSQPSGRRLVAFTFHPSAPFGISVQRANADYLVHFHIRLDPAAFLPL